MKIKLEIDGIEYELIVSDYAIRPTATAYRYSVYDETTACYYECQGFLDEVTAAGSGLSRLLRERAKLAEVNNHD